MSYAYRSQSPTHDAPQAQYQSYPSPVAPRPRSSYYDPSSPQDEPFDIRADFDGDGPRFSERYQQQLSQQHARPQTLLEARGLDSFGGSERGYKPVDDHVAPTGATKSNDEGEEMISVPVLGPEYVSS
jgi:hypothetical protein